jgi:hypothetical protein
MYIILCIVQMHHTQNEIVHLINLLFTGASTDLGNDLFICHMCEPLTDVEFFDLQIHEEPRLIEIQTRARSF